MDKVKDHIDLVDTNMYSKLLSHDDHEIQKLARNFMSGSQEIKRIMHEYTREWCPRKRSDTLSIRDHDKFLKDSEDMFELILQRIQMETEKLYPLIRGLSGDQKNVA
jgi:hypothetical protein